jgi:hypothetical protein
MLASRRVRGVSEAVGRVQKGARNFVGSGEGQCHGRK